jgi:hypothetical protein
MARCFDDDEARAEYYEAKDKGCEKEWLDENFTDDEEDEREDFVSEAEFHESEKVDPDHEYDDSDSGNADLY